jgi:predicted unusual protein kinase regulating ubiquinone biosynthesis (AarF/ABC1/UbiB family)
MFVSVDLSCNARAGGNLLKVARPDNSDRNLEEVGSKGRLIQIAWRRLRHAVLPQKEEKLPLLGYLDFGILSTVDAQVRDALVCAVVLLVFARDVRKVAKLFGELQLLPEDVVDSPTEMRALEQSLNQMFDVILTYPENNEPDRDNTQIPSLRFDKLLDSLARLIPRFRFDLPPYFLNNARALSTLEGIAKSLDPTFR